jgi:hypothetical protein
MSLDTTKAYQISVDRFWDNYLFILDKNAIPGSVIPWYRKHTAAYIKANKNTPLSSQTEQDIDCYLNEKGRLTGLKEWQFRQIADAVWLLFTELVRPQWSESFGQLKAWFKRCLLSRSISAGDGPG